MVVVWFGIFVHLLSEKDWSIFSFPSLDTTCF